MTQGPATPDFNAFAIAVRERFGVQAEQRLAQALSYLRRRMAGQYEVDEFGFDDEFADNVLYALLRPVADEWFRVEVRGAQNIPAHGGALVVSNHSGTLPWDALITSLQVRDHTDRRLRLLAADLVFTMPFVGEIARRCGATLACNEDAEALMRAGQLVGVWPEGFKGIGKPFSQRYTLQRFGRGGFVGAALRTGVPIVPCSVVGAEEIYPMLGTIGPLARLLGLPYFPVTPTFPWLGAAGLIPLPSKWIIEFGTPIDPRTAVADPADPMAVFTLTDHVRETIQRSLYALLMQRRSMFF